MTSDTKSRILRFHEVLHTLEDLLLTDFTACVLPVF